ncbi:unnamed protein product, partial [Prorocentrum cordatum]
VLVAAVGGDDATGVMDFVSMPESDLVRVLETLEVDGFPVAHVRDKRRVADFLDQGGEGTFPILGDETIAEARQRYIEVTAGSPPAAARTTEAQLSGVSAEIGKAAPCVDFAVFGPHGRRPAKAWKFESQVWVDVELETRMIVGPSNFEAWRSCWLVFRLR